jgi:bis(5'-nucleosidyl)-tetraphosphatase
MGLADHVVERSAGAVIFYVDPSGIEYLLLRYGKGHWDFPKGHIEDNEGELDTVVREVREETGLTDVVILPGFRRIVGYMYRKNRMLVRKEVVFYLGRTRTKSVVLSSEHRDYVWLAYEKALERLTFDTAKKTLMEAHRLLSSNPTLQT